MERASLVYNPIARHTPPRERLLQAASRMKARGWEVEVLGTEAAGHATVLAREAAARGSTVVFACGGDGTINEVINGIVGRDVRLAVVRAGTGNVFGKEAHVPRALLRALGVLVDGEPRVFDLGVANGRYFLLMAGVGFDGAVVKSVPPGPKRLLGTTSFVLWGAAEALRFKPKVVDLHVDGESRRGELYWLLLGNTRSYGGVLNITHRAVANDGLLDAYIFSGQGLGWLLGMGARIAAHRHETAEGVSYFRAREIEVVTPGIPVQADGEYFGETPMTFSVVPRALTILLPRGGVRGLLAEEAAASG